MSPNPNPSSRIEHPCWNRILLSRSLVHLRLEAGGWRLRTRSQIRFSHFFVCVMLFAVVVGLCSWGGVVFPRKIRYKRK